MSASAGCSAASTADSVGRALVSLAWPILCSGVAEMLDSSINVMWVGRELGDVSLAALSNANLLWALLFVGASGVSMAGTVWIGQSLGAGDIRGAKAAVATMVTASLAASLICMVPVMIWARDLLECLGTPAGALPQAIKYLRILLLSVPPIYLNVALMATFQAAGDSKTGFYLAVGSVAIDAALNPLLIAGFGPFPALGIEGSALATLTSQLLRLVALLFRGRGHPLRLRAGELTLRRIDWLRAVRLFREGGPMAVQVLWVLVEDMLMISLVNRFGTDVTAAYGAVIQVWNIILMPAAAVGVAITAIVARHIGAGRWDRVRSVTRHGLLYGVMASALMVAFAEIVGRGIYEIFLPIGSLSLGFAEEINREATWSLILLGGYMVWVGVLRATGAVWVPLVISAGVLMVRFPVTLALLGRWQTQAIWWSFPASAAATSILAALHAQVGPYAQRVLSRAG